MFHTLVYTAYYSKKDLKMDKFMRSKTVNSLFSVFCQPMELKKNPATLKVKRELPLSTSCSSKD